MLGESVSVPAPGRFGYIKFYKLGPFLGREKPIKENCVARDLPQCTFGTSLQPKPGFGPAVIA